MQQYKIIILNHNKDIVKRIPFIGNYRDARKEANRLLYSDSRYWGCRVELT